MHLSSIALAIESHATTNHRYGPYPYAVHLAVVAQIGHQFLHLMPSEQHDDLIAACWLHDVIEDCRLTYNDVADVAGIAVADMVYALTNEKGKNRAERANQKYFDEIRNTPGAIFVKMCDRLANCYVSAVHGPAKKLEKYQTEHPAFMAKLFPDGNTGIYQPMVQYLTQLMQSETAL